MNEMPQTTTFVMDLASSLTQALSDGTHDYIYGNGRIAQVNGAITFAQGYAPYGSVATTSGSSASSYGFTNEYQNSYIKLIYLHSRMYSPLTGRYLSRDSWQGDYNRPLSLNRWNYVNGNPVNYADPSGRCSGDPNGLSNPDIACWQEIRFIEAAYSNIDIIPNNWYTNELKAVEKGLLGMTNAFGNKEVFSNVFYRTIILEPAGWWGNLFSGNKMGELNPASATITIYDLAFRRNDDNGIETVIHEFGHFLNKRAGNISMAGFKDKFWDNCVPNPFTGDCWGLLNPQCKPIQPSGWGNTSPYEDFAETFAEYVWEYNHWDFSTIDNITFLPDDDRLNYMKNLIAAIRKASDSFH